MNKKTGKHLYYKAVTWQLKEILQTLMKEPLFEPFCLVGGTSLSLRLGHRKSVDIDLFTNAPYGSLDFSLFENYFERNYPYYSCIANTDIVGFGRSYFIGRSKDDAVKVDLHYHDEISDPLEIIDGIRMASIADIIAMKVDVIISRGGRKKDFWDIHELLNTYPIHEMLQFHQQRFEYTHDQEKTITAFTDFSLADEDFDPVCLKNKIWELIKLDIVEAIDEMTGR